MVDRINLTIDRANFEALKQKAKEKDEQDWGEKESTGYSFEEIDFKVDDAGFENGVMTLVGTLTTNDEKRKTVEFGYATVEFDFCVELAIPIIEYYMKQVNKMKTVLEAMK